jgi:hypothetical protein
MIMAKDITLTGAEIEGIEKKLKDKRATMKADEVQLLEALVRRANSEKPKGEGTRDWQFSWTYHF